MSPSNPFSNTNPYSNVSSGRIVRWNSSRSRESGFDGQTPVQEKVVKAGGGKRGWTSFSVLALMLASAVGAGLLVGWRGEERKEKEREYGNLGKFIRPNYATLSDMEVVSCVLFRDASETAHC